MNYRFIVPCALALLLGAGCSTAMVPSTAPVVSTPTPAPAVIAPAPVQKPTPKARPAPSPTPIKPSLQPSAPVNPKPGPITVIINIQDGVFSPAYVAINAGDSVVWVNQGQMNHTSAATNGSLWDSGNIAPGQSFKKTFPGAGHYDYHCAVHSAMTGTIVVYP